MWEDSLTDQQSGNSYQAPNNQQYQNNNGGYQGNKKPWQGNNNWKGNNGGGGKPWQKNNNWQGNRNNQQGGNKEFQYQPPIENPVFYKPYAVIANKDPDQNSQEVVKRIVTKLSEHGFIARCSGMEGIEEIPEKLNVSHELHLPWKNFDQKQSKFTYNNPLVQGIAKKFHPTWDSLKLVIQSFLSKNVRLLCGYQGNSLSLFMLCWSADGVESAKDKTFDTGSVGHAICVAAAHHIPVFNIAKPDAEERLYKYLGIQNG